MRYIQLSDNTWTLRAIDGAPPHIRGRQIPARVPGCVHTDLIASGLIGDPRIGFNELAAQWIGHTDWEFKRTFEAPADLFDHERIDLVFDGLDTVATILLNGRHAGDAANMFHPHRFDAKRLIRPGSNELLVRLRAPLKYVRELEATLGARPVNGDWDPFIFVRKAACNFGWDWGPRAATCGIHAPARLEAWDFARIASVRPIPRRLSTSEWAVDLTVELEWADPGRPPARARIVAAITPRGVLGGDPSSITMHLGTSDLQRGDWTAISPGVASLSHTITLQNPALWWPKGYGQPNLCELGLLIEDNRTPARRTPPARRLIGIRTTRLDTSPDAHGARFTLIINDTPVFCLGANVIPSTLFPSDEHTPPERGDHSTRPSGPVCQRVHDAAAAGFNMLRVWGGGLYEHEDFYSLCDRLGIMVWQDFMFACAMYPEESPFPALIEAEARHQISGLSHHPAIVLWCGGNECVWGYESWGWKDRLKPGQSWGHEYYFGLLPHLLAQLDPSRPYWPNSPWSGSESIPANDATRGDRHTWDTRLDGYTSLAPRFVSEFGHQAPANLATLAEALPPEGLAVGSQALEHRQRGPGGNAKQYDEPMAEWFRTPRGFAEWHYLAQLLQARAVRTQIEWARATRDRCSGVLVWQLNDVWPGLTWSLVDSAGRPKLAYGAARSAAADCIALFGPAGDNPALFLVNDGAANWTCRPRISRVGFNGETFAHALTDPVTVPIRGVHTVPGVLRLVGRPTDPSREMLVAECGPVSCHWFFARDKDLAYPQPRFEAEWSTDETSAVLKIKALTVLRDLVLRPEYLRQSLRCSTPAFSQPVTMAPGESRHFHFRGLDWCREQNGGTPSPDLLTPPAMWCANHFGLNT